MNAFNHTLNRGMKALLTGVLALLLCHTAFTQACKQVEILHNSPDCLTTRPEGTNPAAGGDRKDCTPIAVCLNQPYTYTAAGSWSTYLWTVTGPTAVPFSPNNTPSVTITWPATGVYTLNLTVTDASGNTYTNCLTVTVKDRPVANFTIAPNNVCAGSTITFTNTSTSTGPTIYNWNFGDPPSGGSNFTTTTNVATTVSHVYNTPGTYTVTLIASSFTVVTVQGGPQGEQDSVIKTCCSDTIKKTVTILPGTLKIECISTVCAGDTATYHAVGCANPTWLPPVGGTILSSSGPNITIIWGNGAVQGQIVAVCPGGCTASVVVPIIPQNPVPVGNLSPCTTNSSSYSLPSLPGTFYNWQLNNITTGTNHNGALSTYPDNNTVWVNWSGLPAGTYELVVNLNNKHICCSSTGKITITPKPKFAAFFDQTVCTNNFASLSVSPVTGSFTWNVLPPNTGASPLSGSGAGFAPSFANAGVYYVQVYETGGNYCNSGIANAQVVKVTAVSTPAPGAITGPTTVCPGGTHSYTMSTPAPTGYYYSWSITGGAGTFQPGGPPSATGDNASILWTSLPGTISVVLQRNSAPPCPSPAVTLTVTQAAIGTISGPQNVCVDASYAYPLAGGTLPPGEDVQWTITPSSLGTVTAGQGTSSPTILWHGQVVGTGPWTAAITAASACGSTTWPVTISKKPVFSLSQSGNICLGGVTLSATPGYTYLWSPGGATTPSITVTTPGTYSVTVTNGSCSITRSITVDNPFAIIPVTCGVGFCNGTGTNEVLSVQVIKPASGSFTYQWYSGTFPSGTLLSTVGPTAATSNSFTAPSDGPFYVVVSYGSCQQTASFNVAKVCCPNINNPQITGVVRNSCNSFTFTGSTPNPTGAAITWNFGDGTTAPGVSGVPISHTYTNAGVYCVTFCVGPPSPNPTNCTGNCTSTTVVVPLQAAISYTLGCNGCINVSNLSTVLPVSGNAPIVTYTWNFGDGPPVTNTTGVAPAHCYAPGSYTLSLTINYSDPSLPLNCTSTATLPVTYTALSINVPNTVCSGVQIPFSSSPGGFLTYAWDFGDTYSAYTPTSSHAYANVLVPTNYTVSLTVTDLLGNTCVATKTITVNPGVTGCTILPASICPGGTATLTAAAGLGTYLWQVETSPGVFAPAPGINTNNTYTVTAPGFYRVIITNGFNCTCTSNKVEVKLAPRPKALIGASTTSLCGPGVVSFTTPILPNHSYAWYANAVAGAPVSMSPFYTTFVSTTTTYFLVLTNEYGCKDTCQQTIKVNAIPAPPVISFSPSLCEGVPVTLTVTNYPGNISWNTGATTTSITVSAAGTYTATYTDPVTGCTRSSSRVINKRPSAELFPHFCDTMPCNCRKDTIYAPRPLIGLFATPYNYQWSYNGNPSGGNSPFYTPAPAGTYQVIITDPTTGCKDTSDTYSIVVPPCDTCNCTGSHWNEIVMTVNNQPKVLQCNSSVQVECNKPITISASFFCADTSCPPKITYALQPPAGPVVTGNAPFTFTPTQSGSYTVKLYGWCGNKICDSCVIKFTVVCDTCNCADSKWGEIVLVAPWGEEVLTCGKERPWKCYTPFTINATYLCANPNLCPSQVTYSLQPPVGPAITGTAPVSYTPTIDGVYTLTLYGWCGTTICDSCVITFIVEGCKPCNCDGSTWGEILVSTPISQQQVKCGDQVDLTCDMPFTVNAAFNCNDDLCPPMVTYSLQPPTGPAITGTAPLTYTPLVSGAYTLTLYGWCGGVICDSCVIIFNVHCDPGCDCANSHWGDKYITPQGGGALQLPCNNATPIPLECNLPYTINANYICGDATCPSAVTYQFVTPTGTTTGAVPFSFTPTVTGNYTLTLYGYCNGILCDSCVTRFYVECDPLPCCRDTIVVSTPGIQTVSLANPAATIANGTFGITGPVAAQYTSIRAEVVRFDLTDNYQGECLKCKILPYSWASMYQPAAVGTITPQITLFNATAPAFNPAGAGQYQNPREVVWASNTPFALPSVINLSFLLPAQSLIACCELNARICVKFTFRDKDCRECEMVVCFEVRIMPSPNAANPIITRILKGR